MEENLPRWSLEWVQIHLLNYSLNPSTFHAVRILFCAVIKKISDSLTKKVNKSSIHLLNPHLELTLNKYQTHPPSPPPKKTLDS